MTIDDVLARLKSGLDRDEADAIRARDAANGPGGDGHLWVVTGSDNAVGVDYDPQATLNRVNAIRQVIELHRMYTDPNRDQTIQANRSSLAVGTVVLENVLRALAGMEQRAQALLRAHLGDVMSERHYLVGFVADGTFVSSAWEPNPLSPSLAEAREEVTDCDDRNQWAVYRLVKVDPTEES